MADNNEHPIVHDTSGGLQSVCTTQRHGSYHSLNVHDIYRENVKTTITLQVAGGCEKHVACSS